MWIGTESLLALTHWFFLCLALTHLSPCPNNNLWHKTLSEPVRVVHSAFCNNRSRNRNTPIWANEGISFQFSLKNSLFYLVQRKLPAVMLPLHEESLSLRGKNEAILFGEGAGKQGLEQSDIRCVLKLGSARAQFHSGPLCQYIPFCLSLFRFCLSWMDQILVNCNWKRCDLNVS